MPECSSLHTSVQVLCYESAEFADLVIAYYLVTCVGILL